MTPCRAVATRFLLLLFALCPRCGATRIEDADGNERWDRTKLGRSAAVAKIQEASLMGAEIYVSSEIGEGTVLGRGLDLDGQDQCRVCWLKGVDRSMTLNTIVKTGCSEQFDSQDAAYQIIVMQNDPDKMKKVKGAPWGYAFWAGKSFHFANLRDPPKQLQFPEEGGASEQLATSRSQYEKVVTDREDYVTQCADYYQDGTKADLLCWSCNDMDE